MCISIVLCIKPDVGHDISAPQVAQIIEGFGYDCSIGSDKLLEEVAELLEQYMPDTMMIEVHDAEEVHCACDIDQDIRNGSKLEAPSKFFEMLGKVMELQSVQEISVFFAYNDFGEDEEVRCEAGSFGKFCDRLNQWFTWQVPGYEPTRNSFFIAESTPFLFTIVKNLSH